MTHIPFTLLFSRFAKGMSKTLGHPLAFGIAVLIIIVWAVSGPIFHFSDSWQLVINTGTNIITCLVVLLVQNTQNRDSATVQVKLDELIRASRIADNSILNTENLTESDLQELLQNYKHIAKIAEDKLQQKSKTAVANKQ